MGRHLFSRRSFLDALRVGPAMLPLLSAERAAAACDGVSGPKRVFILVWPNGMFALNGSSWATTGDNFVLPSHMASLEPYRRDLLLLDGLDYKFIRDSPNPNGGEVSGHACFQGMLTGALYQSFGSSTSNNVAGGPSIDQRIGTSLRAQGYPGLTSLNLQVYARSLARLAWQGAGVPIIPDFDPYHVFTTLFATPSSIPGPADLWAMERSVLDYVAKDLTRFAQKVGGTADRAAVASHLQTVRSLEQRLAAGGPGTGAGKAGTAPPQATMCRPPSVGTNVDVRSTMNFEAMTKLQIDLAVAALAADATRVVVLQLGDQSNVDIILYSLGFRPGGQDGNSGDVSALNSIAHRNSTEKTMVDTWFMQQVAYAIGRLKDVTEKTGTLFDNTVLLAMNNMRTGIHDFLKVPAILAGSCGGYFKTGRSLPLVNTPNNGVLIALANAAGVPTTTFGDAMYGGELSVLRG